MIRLILIVLAVLLSFSAHAEFEIYMENQAGGYLVLTHEECKLDSFKESFPYRGYGTEKLSNGQEVRHEGCYMVPSPPTAEEAQGIPPGVKLVPVVNFITDDGEIHTLSADWFTTEKPKELADTI